IEEIMREHGWTKGAVQRMRKLDSFTKECQRFHSLAALMTHFAMQDYTFSDGARVPAGTPIMVTSQPMHDDEEIYTNADDANSPGRRFFAVSEIIIMMAHVLLTHDVRPEVEGVISP
ncbi:uncharacterized protein PHACADRAFT_56255, partial [Phanerochaete carnosa HHB-10118-sp]